MAIIKVIWTNNRKHNVIWLFDDKYSNKKTIERTAKIIR